MKDRVVDPNKSYVKKGIKVCERWMVFENFLADMGERPDGMTLDRIDNNGDYEPSNCRWATPKQQARHIVGSKRPIRTWNTRPKCSECGEFHKIKSGCPSPI
jgi:hypothetical protein